MAHMYDRDFRRPIHPLHAVLLAFPLPLFLSALVADIAYQNTYLIQWLNFAQWLIAGALLVGAVVLVWALVELIRSGSERSMWHVIYFVALLAMWILGFINALVHAKDAWATMPEGTWISLIVTLLALVATWVGYSGLREEVR